MGQGQSSQPAEDEAASVASAQQLSHDEPSAAATAASTAPSDDATPQDVTAGPSVAAAAASEAPERAEAAEPAAAEEFKAPALPVSSTAAPPPTTDDSASVAADIAHIVALGLTEAEQEQRAKRDQQPQRGEIADVAQELKAKAAMAVDQERNAMGEGMRSDKGPEAAGEGAEERRRELERIEQEMEQMGVQRSAGPSQAPPEGDKEDVQMGGDEQSSSDSDSDSTSSSEESDTAMTSAQGAGAGGRQRNRRGRKQRAASPGSDMGDDDESGFVSSKTAPKTEHEIAEPEVALPAVQKIDEGYELARFGKVESLIETVVVIRAETSGDWRVLDEGTAVCWEDRTVLGQIFEVFGSVQQPFYSIRFPPSALPDPVQFAIGRPTFYAPNLARFVFTRDLRAVKGSDASNIWDEEVGANEMEFSDDEEEAEFRRKQKADRRAQTQSATPGPGGNRQGPRQSATPAPARPSPAPSSLLPARPSVSYADALEPSSFTTPSLPQAAPMSSTAAAGLSSSSAAAPDRSAFGDKPPPGRVGRRMFERDSGMVLGEGEEVEFEFSSGEGSGSDEEEREGEVAMRSVAVAGRGARGGGGRGGGRGAANPGGGQERGRGRGRGRGREQGRGGRTVAPLPTRSAGPAAGLPSRPTFETDFGPEAADGSGPVRMSAPNAAPELAKPFVFGANPTPAAAPPQPDSRFQTAAAVKAESASRSPAAAHPQGSRQGSGSAPSSPYQQQAAQPRYEAAARYNPHTPMMPPAQGAGAPRGYRSDGYGAPMPPQGYYPSGPPAAAYGGYYPSSAYGPPPPAATSGYSPHAPSWAPNAAAGPPPPPVADPRGGHINPRFLSAHGQSPPTRAQQPPQGGAADAGAAGAAGAAGWYAGGPYGAHPPGGGAGGGNGGWW